MGSSKFQDFTLSSKSAARAGLGLPSTPKGSNRVGKREKEEIMIAIKNQ